MVMPHQDFLNPVKTFPGPIDDYFASVERLGRKKGVRGEIALLAEPGNNSLGFVHGTLSPFIEHE
jgi:hypothetical protein